MTADIIPLHPKPFDPIRVEVSSPGTLKTGEPYYLVDYVEADGCRSIMWDGTNSATALEAAADCAGGKMPILDLVGIGQARQ